jgi:hypothetical protein
MTGLGAAQPLAACNRAGSGCGRRGPTSGLQLTRPGPAVGCMPPAARFRGAAGGVERAPTLARHYTGQFSRGALASLSSSNGHALARRLNCLGTRSVGKPEQHVAVVARGPEAIGGRQCSMKSAARVGPHAIGHAGRSVGLRRAIGSCSGNVPVRRSVTGMPTQDQRSVWVSAAIEREADASLLVPPLPAADRGALTTK